MDANVSEITADYTSAGELNDWSETIYPPSGAPVTKTGSQVWFQDGLQKSNTVDGQTSTSEWFMDGNEETFTPYGGFGSFVSSYLGNGALHEMLFPNAAKLTHSYDLAERASSRVFTNSSGAKLSAWEQIGFDDNDNRLTETVFQAQPTGILPASKAGTGTFGYDDLDRLDSFKHAFELITTDYDLDDAGNVNSETGGSSFSYANNRLTGRTGLSGAFTYEDDHFGNQSAQNNLLTEPTSTSYNAASHTKRVTDPEGGWVEYNYDGLERMVSRQDDTGAVVLFFHDGLNDQIAAEHDMAEAIVTTRYLVDSFGVARGKLDIGNETGRSYYMTDPRGNVTQMIGASDQAVKAVFAYDPYGKDKALLSSKIFESNWDSRLRFQMAPVDPTTGSYNIGSRIMNPAINRFAGADMYVSAGSNQGLQMDPLTGNRYLYAGANPAGLIDDGHGPFGLTVCPARVGPISLFSICKEETKEKKQTAPRPSTTIPPVPVIPRLDDPKTPALFDTGILIEADRRGNTRAQLLLRNPTTQVLLTPGVIWEFVAHDAATTMEDGAFLASLGFRVKYDPVLEASPSFVAITNQMQKAGNYSEVDKNLAAYAILENIHLYTTWAWRITSIAEIRAEQQRSLKYEGMELGVTNDLYFSSTCPHCGFTGRIQAQFKLGRLNFDQYNLGDELLWVGPGESIKLFDRPETGYIATY